MNSPGDQPDQSLPWKNSFEQAEEALHRGVVGAAALGRHAPGEAVPLADRDPAGPAVRKSVEIGTLKLRKSVKFDRQIIRKSVAG